MKTVLAICILLCCIAVGILYGVKVSESPRQSNSENNAQCLLAVQRTYPNGRVTLVPKLNYTFLVQTSDNYILYVETLNDETTNITRIDTLFAPVDSSTK